MSEVTYRQNPKTAGRVIDGQAFVVTPHDNKLHTLNGSGAAIWDLAERGCTVEEVVALLTRRFEVDAERALGDAGRFLEDLTARRILEKVGP